MNRKRRTINICYIEWGIIALRKRQKKGRPKLAQKNKNEEGEGNFYNFLYLRKKPALPFIN